MAHRTRSCAIHSWLWHEARLHQRLVLRHCSLSTSPSAFSEPDPTVSGNESRYSLAFRRSFVYAMQGWCGRRQIRAAPAVGIAMRAFLIRPLARWLLAWCVTPSNQLFRFRIQKPRSFHLDPSLLPKPGQHHLYHYQAYSKGLPHALGCSALFPSPVSSRPTLVPSISLSLSRPPWVTCTHTSLTR